jgi:hypothetical protein
MIDYVLVMLISRSFGLLCRVVHFLVHEGEAISAEQAEITRQADYMRRKEQERRDDEVKRANSDNKDIAERNKRNQEDFKRAMQNYEKEMKEKCNYSQCNKGYSKYVFLDNPIFSFSFARCGVCNSRGWNENNGKRSTCSSCKGKGNFPCNQCNGTMLKHPNGVTQPSAPSIIPPKDIPTFGPMPHYESMI